MTPETLDITTLSDYQKRNILGIQDLKAMEFSALYDAAAFEDLRSIQDATKATPADFAVYFDKSPESASTYTPKGDDGQFTFKGQLSVYVSGSSVNEVVEMKISISATTVIDFEIPTVASGT